MQYSEIKQLISGIGLPYAYYQFPEDTGQAPPFICFYYTVTKDLYADNINFQRITKLIIEFYSEDKDFFTEALIEDALKTASLTYLKSERFIDSERMYETVYETEVLITQEDTNV